VGHPALLISLPAHGIGSRSDLPLPLPLALGGGVMAVAVSFVLVIAIWPQPALRGGQAGRPLPAVVASVLDSGLTRWALRLLGLLVTGWVAVAAWFGPDDALNPSAAMVYAVFWVGVVAVGSALLGPLWRLLNPLRTVHLLVNVALRRDPARGVRTYPTAWGYWPAALAVGSFLWLELVAPNRASTVAIREYATGYALVMLIGAALFGSRWFSRADGFEVLSSLFGRLSVLGRRDDGVLVVRNPLAGLDQLPTAAGLVAVVVVALGGTAFDGLSAEPWWQRTTQSLPDVTAGTLGLLAVIVIVAAVFIAATMLTSVGDPEIPRRELPGQFAASLVPVMLGYTVAHYFSLLVLAGQLAVIDLSDPLGTGANLLGTGTRGVDYRLLTPTVVAWVQVISVVGGHIAGVVLAHDRAVLLFPRRRAIIGQIPLVVVMLVFTMAGLWLLWSA
jgi:hypothetical protein